MLHPDFSELEDEFGEVVDFLNEGPPEIPTERPSEVVWAAIADGLTVSDGSSQPSQFSAAGAGDEGDPASASEVGSADDTAGNGFGGLADSADETNVRPFERPAGKRASAPSNGRRFAVITAVAAAILLVAVPLSLAFRGDSVDQRAELLALGDVTGAGTAELSDRNLEVSLEGLDPLEGAEYELWLLDLEGDDLQDLVSLGIIEEDGTFEIPEGLDLSEFSVVDVSIEPNDGDETHSGNSVLRGPLSDE